MKKKALIFQNSKGDGPGIFSGFLEAKGWHRRIVHLYGGESIPADWSRYDFLMIMGARVVKAPRKEFFDNQYNR